MQRMLMMLVFLSFASASTNAEEQREATMYKTPFCGCCDGHAEHLRANGFRVTVHQSENLSRIKQKYRVPQEFEGCHTILVDGYVVEGHVPATIIHKLLKERPRLRGISLPGMPEGSPGMSGQKAEPFVVYQFGDQGSKVFARE